MAIWRMRIAFWITTATNTHSDYLKLIAFPLQQWWNECASISRKTFIACVVERNYIRTFSLFTCKQCIETKEFSIAHGLL
jgi:hypothetical protein